MNGAAADGGARSVAARAAFSAPGAAIGAAIGAVIASLSIGTTLAWRTAKLNSSIVPGSDAVVFALWIALGLGAWLVLSAALSCTLARVRGLRSSFAGLGAACAWIAFAAYCVLDQFVAVHLWGSETNLTRARAMWLAGSCAAAAFAWFAARSSKLQSLSRVTLFLSFATLAVGFVRLALPDRPTSDFETRAASLPKAAADVRVLVLGLDGAEWKRIRPLVDARRLPNFKRLIDGGLCSPLATIHPTWSPIVWSTIATGVEEKLHGVHDFTELALPGMDRGVQRTYAKLGEGALLPPHSGLVPLARWATQADWLEEIPISSRHRRVKALWNILSERGATVAVMSWFASFPAEVVHGWFVSDNDPWRQAANEKKFDNASAMGDGLTYPNELIDELARAIPPIPDDERLEAHKALRGPLYASLTQAERDDIAKWPDLTPMAAAVQGGDRFTASAGLHLWREKKPQFEAVYLRAIDNLSHRLRTYTDVIDHTYEWTDRLLGDYLDALDAHTVLIVLSDHGWTYEPETPVGHNHSPDGVVVIYGAGVDPHASFAKKPSVLDLTPTILALFGLPASQDMKGRAWREAFRSPSSGFDLARIPDWGIYRPEWSAAVRGAKGAQQEGVKRLRALGYAD